MAHAVRGAQLDAALHAARHGARRAVEVVRVDPERALLLVRGAVPGARNGLVVIRKVER